jgi:acyl-CoA thioesterase I
MMGMSKRIGFWLLMIFGFIRCGSVKSGPETPDSRTFTYLALGDSYTIGESVRGEESYPMQLIDRLRDANIRMSDPVIVATTGWTTLDLARAMDSTGLEGQRFDLVSLLIGVNDQYQGKPFEQYETNFRHLLDLAISLAGGDTGKVFVVSIPDYAYTPFGQQLDAAKISRELDAYNEVNREIARQYQVIYFDITGISRQGLDRPMLVAKDQLHPSGRMYREWVETMIPEIRAMLSGN